ncbi:MAG: putative porin [Candidatus Omnitrophica bacterium]|nr:putative porin [Candidatus Omnitrophota bacterium]
MKRLIVAVTLMLTTALAFGSEVERLVDKLVEKGILTQGEAYKIVAEAKEEARKDEVAMKGEIDKVPAWIKNTKFKGDARLRYEMQDKEGKTDRHRGRIRVRWGFDTQVNPQIKFGLRIASGSAEQTSTNQTFTNSFSSKNLWLDKAYVSYSPISIPYTSIIGGKMSNPFYNTDLVWDGDVTPEGLAVTFKNSTANSLFLNAGFFPLLEISGDYNDPYLLGAQVGFSGKIAEKKFNAGLAYYRYEGLKDTLQADISPGYEPDGNTLTPGGAYVYNYNLWDFNIDFTPFEIPAGSFKLPVKFYGNYVVNKADDVDEDTGYLVGFNIGKASKKGSWQLGYNYRKVEADCVPAIFNDSDMNGGATDIKGHKLGFTYALTDHSTMGIAYLIGESLGVNRTDERNTLQLDYIVKF